MIQTGDNWWTWYYICQWILKVKTTNNLSYVNQGMVYWNVYVWHQPITNHFVINWITVFTFNIGKYARSPLRIKMIHDGHKFLVFLSIPWCPEWCRAWWQSLKTKAWRYLSKDPLKYNMAKAVARVVDITHPQGSGCKQLISSWQLTHLLENLATVYGNR